MVDSLFRKVQVSTKRGQHQGILAKRGGLPIAVIESCCAGFAFRADLPVPVRFAGLNADLGGGEGNDEQCGELFKTCHGENPFQFVGHLILGLAV
jgi:hypothetical protein